jgi:uncharacterized protein (TIGR00730 family)
VARVCVFCASSLLVEQRWLDLAETVGTRLAELGHVVVSGGGRVGMMGTLVAGVRKAGGHTVGVIPQSLVDREVADTGADELVVTDGMAARKIVMLERSDLFLALPGGLGTLDELYEVWTTAALGLHTKPVVLLDCDGFYAGLLDWLDGLVRQAFIPEGALAMVHVVRSVDEALDAVQRFG